jgi:4-oxalocrotonate tautomerase
MPYINIRIGENLNSEKKDQLYQKTTCLMNEIMGKRREVTVVHILESESHQWATNGITLSNEDPVCAFVDIKVTEGTNTSQEKAEMISQTIKMLRDVVGTLHEACYVIIDEIPANSWGYNGKTQSARTASTL